MKLIIIVALLGIGLTGIGHWYQVQEQCTDFKLDISWDTIEGGLIMPDQQDPTVKISYDQEAKLVVTTTTPREGTIKITVDSPDEAIEMHKMESSNIETLPCVVRELYVPKGIQEEISVLWFKAPVRPTYYGISVCATLDNQCKTCKNAYFSVVSEAIPTTTPIPEPSNQQLCYFVIIMVVVAAIVTYAKVKWQRRSS
jgi:hypothetical protein